MGVAGAFAVAGTVSNTAARDGPGKKTVAATATANTTEKERIRLIMAGIILRTAYKIKVANRRLASDAALLRRAVSGLQRRLRAQDEDGSIAPTGLGILGRLFRLGVANATEIAQLEGLQPQSLTRALKSLHDAGLIDRWTDEEDRRRTLLAITPKGEALLLSTIRNRVAWLARVMETRLSPAERDTLRAAALLMERITGGND
jgi:DNA-binding MarR family transcriptional regulator